MYMMACLFILVTVPSLERKMFFLFFLYIHPAGSSRFSFHPSWTRQLWIFLINSELSVFFMQWWSAALLVLNRFPWGSKRTAIFPCSDLPFQPAGRVVPSFLPSFLRARRERKRKMAAAAAVSNFSLFHPLPFLPPTPPFLSPYFAIWHFGNKGRWSIRLSSTPQNIRSPSFSSPLFRYKGGGGTAVFPFREIPLMAL